MKNLTKVLAISAVTYLLLNAAVKRYNNNNRDFCSKIMSEFDEVDKNGSYPLNICNFYKKIKVILKAFINKKNSEGWTALHIATKNKQEKLVQLLLNSGADADIEIGNGADTNTDIMTGYKNTSHALDNNVVLPTLSSTCDKIYNERDNIGDTALILAIKNKCTKIAEAILEKCNPNRPDRKGAPPLVIAVIEGFPPSILLKHSMVDVNKLCANGASAFSWASVLGRNKMKEEIKSHPEFINQADYCGRMHR